VGARILFSEGSSLTAREFLSVLGPAGHHIEIVDPSRICICRFSRWTRRVHQCPAPGTDPLAYSSLAILLGTAAYVGTRGAVLSEALRLVLQRGPYAESREALTPILRDTASAIPLAFVAARVLLRPRSAERLAGAAVGAYSVTPEAIKQVAVGTAGVKELHPTDKQEVKL
jgi:hypothetical protein